ncbi:MAG: hypothetical protein JXQ87_06275 [Bacteroidia bacterium]
MKITLGLFFLIIPFLAFSQSFSFFGNDACSGEQIRLRVYQEGIDSINWETNVKGTFITLSDSIVIFKSKMDQWGEILKSITVKANAYYQDTSITGSMLINVYQRPNFYFQVEQFSNTKEAGGALIDSSKNSITLLKNYLPASIFFNVWVDNYSTVEESFLNDKPTQLPIWKYVARENSFELKAYATNQFGCTDTFEFNVNIIDKSLRSIRALDSNKVVIRKWDVYEASANSISPFKIEVFDINGVSVYANGELRTTHFVEANLAPGIYIFMIRFENDKTIIEKVMVSN